MSQHKLNGHPHGPVQLALPLPQQRRSPRKSGWSSRSARALGTSRPWGHGDPSPVPSFHPGSGPALHPGFTMELDLLSLSQNKSLQRHKLWSPHAHWPQDDPSPLGLSKHPTDSRSQQEIPTPQGLRLCRAMVSRNFHGCGEEKLTNGDCPESEEKGPQSQGPENCLHGSVTPRAQPAPAAPQGQCRDYSPESDILK